MTHSNAIQIGIIGTGMIVPEFLKGAALVDSLNVRAICYRKGREERLAELSTLHPFEKAYDDYELMLADPDIDAIYVAVPNHLHHSFAKKALEAKKHIILEKPFTATYNEALELAQLAREKELFLFEAITNQYYPNFYKMKVLLPDLGDIKIVQINYSQYSSRYDAFKEGKILPAFDPQMAGGALMDLNVYNIHLIVGLFGRPDSTRYYPNIEQGVDTSGIMILSYPTFQCVAIGAKDCRSPVSMNIQGDHGYIHSNAPSNVLSSFDFAPNGEEPTLYTLNTIDARFYYELSAFSEMVTKKDFRLRDTMLEQSLTVMEILDAGRKQL